MKKNNVFSNIFGYLALVSGSIWFGAYIGRLLSAYQMYEETGPVLRNFLNSSNLPAVFEVYSPLVTITFVTYIILIISFTIYLFLTPLKLKENGWLFITAGIIYLTLPFEAILLVIDYELIRIFAALQFGSDQIMELITKRIYKLNSFPIIMILSYLSIPYLLVFKPFTMKAKDEN